MEPHVPMQCHVVVVGAGFGGLNAAKILARGPVRVTVIDQANHHTFQPLLYQVATAGLGADDIAHSVRGIYHGLPNVWFRLGTVTGVDSAARKVILADGGPIGYDYLVLAPGATTAWFGVPGAREHAFSLKSLSDAIALRNHVLAQFERADADPALVDGGALTFTIVGGGPTGVELAGALVELFRMVLAKDFAQLDVSQARVVLVEAGEFLLPAFHPRSRARALRTLQARGVEVRLGATIESIAPHEARLVGGETIPTATVVWAAGVRAHPLADALAESLGLEQLSAGRVRVQGDLSIPGHPEIFVVGDMAAVGHGAGLCPQLAPVAIQAGRHAARQILGLVQGRPTQRFAYRDKGVMATIGRNAAVAELPFGLRFGGFPAWVAWLVLHLWFLIGFRNRLNVVVNWAWNYLTYDRGARLIVEPPGSQSGSHSGSRGTGPVA
jgi:NADH:quinone reductase (non-electrogenic)